MHVVRPQVPAIMCLLTAWTMADEEAVFGSGNQFRCDLVEATSFDCHVGPSRNGATMRLERQPSAQWTHFFLRQRGAGTDSAAIASCSE